MTAPPPVAAPTLELLSWLAAGSRTYGETMEAWRTSCPRLSAWEDAIAEGLVEVRRDGSNGPPLVALTRAGRTVLEAGPRGAVPAR